MVQIDQKNDKKWSKSKISRFFFFLVKARPPLGHLGVRLREILRSDGPKMSAFGPKTKARSLFRHYHGLAATNLSM